MENNLNSEHWHTEHLSGTVDIQINDYSELLHH